MYVVSFIDAGKLVQVSTPSAVTAATLQGYLPTCRVFKSNKLVQDIQMEALVAECQKRYGKSYVESKVRALGIQPAWLVRGAH